MSFWFNWLFSILNLSHTHASTHKFTYPLPPTLSLTHTHSHTLSYYPSHSLTLTLFLTHSHTLLLSLNPHTLSLFPHTNSHTPFPSISLSPQTRVLALSDHPSHTHTLSLSICQQQTLTQSVSICQAGPGQKWEGEKKSLTHHFNCSRHQFSQKQPINHDQDFLKKLNRETPMVCSSFLYISRTPKIQMTPETHDLFTYVRLSPWHHCFLPMYICFCSTF